MYLNFFKDHDIIILSLTLDYFYILLSSPPCFCLLPTTTTSNLSNVMLEPILKILDCQIIQQIKPKETNCRIMQGEQSEF